MILFTMASTESCDSGFLQILAGKLGLEETALRFIISMFAGYPLAIFLRDNLHGTSATTKHLFISAIGLAMCYFNYGMDTGYLLFCSMFNYVLLLLIGGTGIAVIISFAFNMLYLLVSYAMYASDDYDMNWTTPQCILTLRMISVAYDLYDGHQPVEKLSSEQKSLCFKEAPGPLEMISYSFFFGYFLAGPQYPLRQYRDYMDGKLLDNESGKSSDTFQPAMRILGIGLIYFIIEALISPSFSEAYLLSQEFSQSSFFYKLFYISLFGRFTINKYVTFWLVAEGVCILSGIAYAGKDRDGNVKWTACSGLKPLAFETALSVRDMVATFNTSTNTWLARYVYKRLKFLGNRYVSQIVSLMFLAVWHGLHIGYYNNFILEFFIVMFDVQAAEIFTKVPILNKVANHRLLALIRLVVLKFFMLLFMGYPLVSFVLLRWSKIHLVYKEVYYIGHIFFLLWPVLSFGFIMPWFKSQRRKSQDLRKEDAKTK